VETALWSGDVARLIGGKIVLLIRKRFLNKLLKLPNVLLMNHQHGSLAHLLYVISTVDGNKYFAQRCVAIMGKVLISIIKKIICFSFICNNYGQFRN
jgi:hypothetical protein